ncbi:MAG: hypothetical protein J1D88_03020 [Treponema sp.]|nr:hypothetical protein [Treponema sp.]
MVGFMRAVRIFILFAVVMIFFSCGDGFFDDDRDFYVINESATTDVTFSVGDKTHTVAKKTSLKLRLNQDNDVTLAKTNPRIRVQREEYIITFFDMPAYSWNVYNKSGEKIELSEANGMLGEHKNDTFEILADNEEPVQISVYTLKPQFFAKEKDSDNTDAFRSITVDTSVHPYRLFIQ